MDLHKIVIAVFLLLINLPGMATTTSTTSRKIQIDGYIGTPVNPGTNGIEWESDEIYPGYQSVVNWYVSWDDNNFYIGRKGFSKPTSSNSLGSVLYIRADYAGAVFTPAPITYDKVTPNLVNMGGIDFVAYIKSGYNEYRTYNGAWSASAALSPVFQNNVSGTTDYMEVAIPWSKITNGNGKPSNVRLSMLQVDLGNTTCTPLPKPFIFSESPWGDGSGGSPTLGINDGAPTSARQPGGCNVETATSTRWWGCYPVISGVASNGFVAQAPNAGPAQDICDLSTTTTMAGNQPSADAIGTWSYVASKSSQGLTAPVIVAPNSKNSSITGLNGLGTYVFAWSINYGGCPAVPDTVRVTRWQRPTVSKAGRDTAFCFPRSAYTLKGNQAVIGKGIWTVTAGAATLGRNDTAITAVSGLGIGLNTFTWTISNGPACAPSVSQVNIVINTLPKVISNPDSQKVCSPAPASFTIGATGSNLVYQWQLSKKKGAPGSFVNVPALAPYANSQTNTLSIAATDTSLNGVYRCFVKGTCAPADTSAGAKLIVNMAPSISAALSDQTQCEGQSVSFHAKVKGTSLNYKWKKNNSYITGATRDSLFIGNLALADSGLYSYEVSGVCGSTQTSGNANLLVQKKPVITKDILNQSACPGGSVTYTLNTAGTNLSYIWQEKTKSGAFVSLSNTAVYSIVSNATSSSLTISNATLAMDSNLYRCIVSGSCAPPVNSKIALLKINPINIISQPKDTLVCEKMPVWFVAKASGAGLTYAWSLSTNGGATFAPVAAGGLYSGINSDTLKISTVMLSMQKYKYKCAITGSCDGITMFSSNSAIATLSVSARSNSGAATASQSPICAGTAAKLNAAGTTGTIQWQQSPNGLNSWSNVTGGSKGDSLQYTTGILFQTSFYRTYAKNGACKTDTSNAPVKIVVTPVSAKGTVVATSSNICINQTAQIQVSGSRGSLQWQQSANGTTSWANVTGPVGPDSTVYKAGILAGDTYFRVVAKNGVCPSDTAVAALIKVTQTSKSGTLNAAKTTICENSNAFLTLKGRQGTVTWMQSLSGTGPWATVTSGTITDSTYSSPALVKDTYFQVTVKNGVCDSVNSAIVKITVNPKTNKGLVTATQSSICTNQTAQVLVTGAKGTIQWQQSANGTTGWGNVTGPVGPDSTLYTVSNLISDTYFRVVVKNGVCAADSANATLIKVSLLSKRGSLTASQTGLCAGTTAKLSLKGARGTVAWMQSTTGNPPWNAVSNGIITDSTYISLPLSRDIFYQAILRSGVCDTVNTPIVKITVTPKSVKGIITAVQASICANKPAQLKVTGATGSIQWQQTATPANGWINVPAPKGQDSIYTTNLLQTSYFRVLVINGICPADTSSQVQIAVSPVSVTGKLSAGQTAVCAYATTLLSLKGSRGKITWSQASGSLGPWNALTTSDSLFKTANLTSDTYFRATIKNGVCDTLNTPPIKVSVFKPLVASLGPDTMICQDFGKSIVLKTDKPFVSYVWNDDSNGPTLTAVSPGIYWVDVKDANGCTARSSIKISDCTRFFIPDVITPNGDKVNDSFVILGHRPGSSLEIYNRWGTLVFQRSSYFNGEWDGGNEVAGNYLYIYTLQNATEHPVYTGWVTIVRDK